MYSIRLRYQRILNRTVLAYIPNNYTLTTFEENRARLSIHWIFV